MNQLDLDLVDRTATPSRKETSLIIKNLKEADQDFEFYPTTEQQIKTIISDISKLLETHTLERRHSREALTILDIGAGDGRVLDAFAKALENHSEIYTSSINKCAIEKSELQISQYRRKNITLLGTDFDQTIFISKSADLAFVNPPYSDFSHWIQTLLTGLNFRLLYAILPERWENDPAINTAIKNRQIKDATIIATSDFLDAHRQARGKVHIVRFSFNDYEKEIEMFELRSQSGRHINKPEIGFDNTDPFQLFIENELGLKQTYSETTHKFREYQERERVREKMADETSEMYQLVTNQGVLHALIENYENDMRKTIEEYKKISQIDPDLLSELGVDYKSIKEGVKDKLLGYRNVYWNLLFDYLDTLKERLTTQNKTKLLNTLQANNLDFTHKNALYIISFAVDMTNDLIEDSILEVFKSLTCAESIKTYYKSNEHVFQDRWHFQQNSLRSEIKYTLDYRFIYSAFGNFSTDSWKSGLNDDAADFLNDLKVALKLLGYSDLAADKDRTSVGYGETVTIKGLDQEWGFIDLVQVRFYKNGNRHIKFNQSAMLRLNVTVSRLLGWIKDKSDYVNETGETEPIPDTIWKTTGSLKITTSSVLAITHKPATNLAA